jgi:uncharacterized protein YkwD
MQKPLLKLLSALILLFAIAGCEKNVDEPTDTDSGKEIADDFNPSERISQYFTQEQQDLANTAKDVSYLTDEEKLVIFYCNLARLDGQTFSDALLNLRNSEDTCEKTLVEALDTTKDLPMLFPNEQLCNAAAAHASDLGTNGLLQHESSDGTKPFDRIREYYHGNAMAENVAAGNGKAFFIVRQLLIDRGSSTYGHRKTILSSKFCRIGVAINEHTKYKYCCVQDFSDDKGD